MQIPNYSGLRSSLSLFWERPWKLIHSLIIGFSFLLMGIFFEIITGGKGIKPIGMPVNIYIALVFISLLVYLHYTFGNQWLVKWLTGAQAAIGSIIVFAVLVLLMGLIPQDQSYGSSFFRLTGLAHIKQSWPFAFAFVWLLTVLGLVALSRTVPYQLKNLGFILNHWGLWIILVASWLGAGDVKHWSINLLEEGNENNIAISDKGDIEKLPFSLKLVDFSIDEYPSRLAVTDIRTGKIMMEKGKLLPLAETGLKTSYLDWAIVVSDYLSQGMLIDGVFQKSFLPGSCPAARVKIHKKGTKDTICSWISSGSYNQKMVTLPLNNQQQLMLSSPEARKFSSRLVVINDYSPADTEMLVVNKPLKIMGWKIYQTGYDQSKGKWSSLSVLEAVRDPWSPIVYLGFYMLMAGAFYMYWIGRKN